MISTNSDADVITPESYTNSPSPSMTLAIRLSTRRFCPQYSLLALWGALTAQPPQLTHTTRSVRSNVQHRLHYGRVGQLCTVVLPQKLMPIQRLICLLLKAHCIHKRLCAWSIIQATWQMNFNDNLNAAELSLRSDRLCRYSWTSQRGSIASYG